MIRLLVVLLILISPITGYSATYYVDYVGGADTNNGTTTGTPFKRCPGSPNATDVAAAVVLSGGDTVVFKGGVEYKDSVTVSTTTFRDARILIKWSGTADTSAGRITYSGNTGWGSGKAIITGEGTVQNGFWFPVLGSTTDEYGYPVNYGPSFITIDGFYITNFNQSTVLGDGDLRGVGIRNTERRSNYVNVSNCDFTMIGKISDIYGYGYGISNSYGDYWKVFKNTFVSVGAVGINMASTKYTEIYENYFTGDTCWGMGITTAKYVAQSIYIHDNVMRDNGREGWMATGCHANWVFTYSQGGNTSTGLDYGFSDLRIYNNYFYQTKKISLGTSFFQTKNNNNSTWDGVYFFNNVLINHAGGHPGIEIIAHEAWNGIIKNIYILNNTIYTNYSSHCIGIQNTDVTSGRIENVYIKNNICTAGSGHCIEIPMTIQTAGPLITGVTYTIEDYNALDDFINVGAASNEDGITFVATGTTPTKWTEKSILRSYGIVGTVEIDRNVYSTTKLSNARFYTRTLAHNWDTVYFNQPQWLDLFVTGSPTFDINSQGDQTIPTFESTNVNSNLAFRLSAEDTVAVDQGETLSYIPALAVDKAGVARPQGAAWDIGAYEYVALAADVYDPVITSFSIPSTYSSKTVPIQSLQCEDEPLPIAYNNGAPDYYGGSEMGAYIQAESFTVPVDSTINRIRTWVFIYTGLTAPPVAGTDYGVITYWIYDNNAGVPGNVLTNGSVTPEKKYLGRFIINSESADVYQYEWSIPDFALTAGTVYHLGVHNGTAEQLGVYTYFYWMGAANNGTAEGHYWNSFTSQWVAGDEENAFELRYNPSPVYYCVTTSNDVALCDSGSLWTTVPQTAVVFSNTGVQTAYAWCKDNYDNITDSASTSSVTITTGGSASPTVSSFVIQTASATTTVPITAFICSDDVLVTGYCVLESADSTLCDTVPNPLWSSQPQTSYTFSTEGAKTLYAFCKDGEDQRSAAASATTFVGSITTPPIINSFTVPKTTTTPVITIALDCEDDVAVVDYCILVNSTNVGQCTWVSTLPTQATLTKPSTNMLTAFCRDADSRVSDPSVGYSTLITGTTFTLGVGTKTFTTGTADKTITVSPDVEPR